MITLKRRENWYSWLIAYCEAAHANPFDPVKNNCALFAAGAIQAMTGADPLADLGIAHPESETDVARILIEFGGVRGLATKYLGEPVPALLAAPGDVLLKQGDPGETLGVMTGSKVMFLAVDGTVQMRGLDECICAWKVGSDG